MFGRGNIRSGKCLSGELSSWGSVRSENCPSGKCQLGNCPRGRVSQETVRIPTQINLEINRKRTLLKLVSAIFYQIFIFHQMIALQKL